MPWVEFIADLKHVRPGPGPYAHTRYKPGDVALVSTTLAAHAIETGLAKAAKRPAKAKAEPAAAPEIDPETDLETDGDA